MSQNTQQKVEGHKDLFSVAPVIVPIDNENKVVIHACPICGSTELVADIIVSIRQDMEGGWSFVPIEQISINDNMQELNNEVRCINEYCGYAYDEHDQIITLNGDETMFDYWVRTYLGANPAHIAEEGLSEDDAQKWREWYLEVHYRTWSGVMGDCVTLSM